MTGNPLYVQVLHETLQVKLRVNMVIKPNLNLYGVIRHQSAKIANRTSSEGLSSFRIVSGGVTTNLVHL